MVEAFRLLPRRWQLVLGGLLAYSMLHFLYSGVLWGVRTPGGGLLSTFPGPLMYRAAAAWPVFHKPWLITENLDKFHRWHYGPMLHFLTFPFIMAGSLRQAMLIILGINYVVVGTAFLLWCRRLMGAQHRTNVVLLIGLAALWLNYQPLLEVIAGRECELWELLLVTASLWALRAKREGLAGLCIGVAGMIKFVPLIFIPYCFVKGFRRAGWSAVLTVLAITLVSMPLFEAKYSILLYWLSGETRGRLFSADYDTQSILNMLYKMFTPFDLSATHPVPPYGPILYPIGMMINLMVLLGCGWWLWRWRRQRFLEVEYALLLISALLVLPHTSPYYLIFMLPALSIGLAVWVYQPRALRPVVKGALVGAIVLSGFLIPMTCFEWLLGIPAVLISRALWMYLLPGVGMILASAVMLEIHQLLRGGRLPALRPQLEGREP